MRFRNMHADMSCICVTKLHAYASIVEHNQLKCSSFTLPEVMCGICAQQYVVFQTTLDCLAYGVNMDIYINMGVYINMDIRQAQCLQSTHQAASASHACMHACV